MKEHLEQIKIVLLTVIALCGIILVIQGFKEREVYINNRYLNVDGRVSVKNRVDVNLDAIQEYRVGCHKSYMIDGNYYYALDVHP